MDDLRARTIDAIKRVTQAKSVLNFPSGEGEGYATAMDGQTVRFVDDKGTHRSVRLADLNLSGPKPAPKPTPR